MQAKTLNEGKDVNSLKRVAAIVEADEAALPWLDRFYEQNDVVLLEALASGPRTVNSLLSELDGIDVATIRRANRRGVVTIDDEIDLESDVTATPFWDRFEYWIMFEGWRDIPSEARRSLAESFLHDYTESIKMAVADVKAGRPISDETDLSHYVLLEEAQAIARGAHRVFIGPCSCRRTFQHCDMLVDVCLWFDDNKHEVGWEISHERAFELLEGAARDGLMFTSDSLEPGKASWICCCCSDCCMPHLAAQKLDASTIWPQRRYQMVVDHDLCKSCRVCLKRCPFDALTMDGKGKDGVLRLDMDQCRGCGVCETGCKSGAIVMSVI